MQHDLRRSSPRIETQALCWELVDDKETSSLIVDVSSDGARLERPYTGGRLCREAPLQIEIPGIDEVMWAKGDVVFDQLVQTRRPTGGAFGLLRRTGYRIVLAAARDLRLLRDFVYDMERIQRDQWDDLELAPYNARLARA
jgi:hypothetical protein